jgi:anti-sigma factor (TIGR02949 family)
MSIRLLDCSPCGEVISRLDEYVDRTLTIRERRQVEAHLGGCLECAAKFRFEAALVRSIRERLRRIDVPPHLFETVVRRLEAEV